MRSLVYGLLAMLPAFALAVLVLVGVYRAGNQQGRTPLREDD